MKFTTQLYRDYFINNDWLGGGFFKYFFNVQPEPWGRWTQFDDPIVSDGLVQPPTRKKLLVFGVWLFVCFYTYFCWGKFGDEHWRPENVFVWETYTHATGTPMTNKALIRGSCSLNEALLRFFFSDGGYLTCGVGWLAMVINQRCRGWYIPYQST